MCTLGSAADSEQGWGGACHRGWTVARGDVGPRQLEGRQGLGTMTCTGRRTALVQDSGPASCHSVCCLAMSLTVPTSECRHCANQCNWMNRGWSAQWAAWWCSKRMSQQEGDLTPHQQQVGTPGTGHTLETAASVDCCL